MKNNNIIITGKTDNEGYVYLSDIEIGNFVLVIGE